MSPNPNRKLYIKVPVQDVYLEDIGDIEDPDSFDNSQIEHLIFQLQDYKEVAVIVFKALGYEPKEIAEILGYTNIGSYYQLNYRLKKHYSELIDKEKS